MQIFLRTQTYQAVFKQSSQITQEFKNISVDLNVLSRKDLAIKLHLLKNQNLNTSDLLVELIQSDSALTKQAFVSTMLLFPNKNGLTAKLQAMLENLAFYQFLPSRAENLAKQGLSSECLVPSMDITIRPMHTILILCSSYSKKRTIILENYFLCTMMKSRSSKR